MNHPSSEFTEFILKEFKETYSQHQKILEFRGMWIKSIDPFSV